MSLWKKAAIAVIALVVMGWVGKEYIDANYITKPKPYEARSVLYGMQVRESLFNATIQAYQKQDTATIRIINERIAFLADSLRKAQ